MPDEGLEVNTSSNLLLKLISVVVSTGYDISGGNDISASQNEAMASRLCIGCFLSCVEFVRMEGAARQDSGGTLRATVKYGNII